MSSDPHYERLRAAYEAGEPALTIELGKLYLARDPEDFGALMWYGMALEDVARYAEARATYDRALAIAEFSARVLVQRQLGHLHENRSEVAEAEAWYLKAIEGAPDAAQGYVYLGGLLAKNGRLEDAERVLRRGVSCTEGPVEEAWFNLGLVLRARERYLDALECFRTAVGLDAVYEAALDALHDVEQVLFHFPEA